MPTAIFLSFTCARDADLVPLWAEAIRRHFPSAKLAAAVDAADADMPLPKNILRIVTDFPRGGNLNGIPAVAGILGTIALLGEHFQLPVVKIDTDTILTGSSWLDMLAGHHYLGFEGGSPMYASGICYAMTPFGARHLLKKISPWPWQTKGKFPEDETICRLAQMYLPSRLEPWGHGEHILAFSPPHFSQPDLLLKTSVAVHCGQASTLHAYGPNLNRTHLVRRQMLTLLRAIKKSSPRGSRRARISQ